MRHTVVLGITLLVAFTLGACGGEGSGDVPGDVLDPAPSSNLPAVVDTTGMSEAELEAKIEEIEALHDTKMEELQALAPKVKDGAGSSKATREMMQLHADMRALREQMKVYDDALDALSR